LQQKDVTTICVEKKGKKKKRGNENNWNASGRKNCIYQPTNWL